jgi:hypothetical protein
VAYSHHQYIKEEIVLPLNLHHTYSLISEVDMEDLTSGYYLAYDKDIDTAVIQFVNTSGGKTWGKMNNMYKRIIRILRENP